MSDQWGRKIWESITSLNGGTVENPVDPTIRVETVDDFTYIGRAKAGSLNTDPVWLIYRIDTVDDQVSKVFPDGIASFTNIWDDRAILTYA